MSTIPQQAAHRQLCSATDHGGVRAPHDRRLQYTNFRPHGQAAIGVADHVNAEVRCALLQMIVEPEQRGADFAKAGSDIISVHCEQAATIHLDRVVNQVRLFCFFVLVR